MPTMKSQYKDGVAGITVDGGMSTPLYLQLVESIIRLIESNYYKEGDTLPSMNVLSADCDISRETVKKAYAILRDKGYIEPAHGKGFYIKKQKDNEEKNVLMLFDKLSTYKLVLYRSFAECVGKNTNITIHLHNQDISLFEKLLEENKGKYDYYVVSPNFPLTKESQRKTINLLKKIPNRKLIVLDRHLPEIKGNIGAVFQNFEIDVYAGLEQGIDLIRRYKRIHIIYTSHGSLYSKFLIKGITQFCKDYLLDLVINKEFNIDLIKKGDLYIVLNGQHDTELFDILRSTQKQKLRLGKDIGVVSYNDSPINEFILEGLTTLSTDFVDMGRLAAEMVKTGELSKIHNKFSLIIRKSL